MNIMAKYPIAILLLAVLLGLGFFYALNSENGTEGVGFGTVARTVTFTSSTVQTASTTVITATENLQRLVMKNPGPAQVFCAFGSTPSLGKGLVLDVPNTTSTNQERDITDPSFLSKPLSCIASGVSSTLYITKYSF